MKFVIHIHNHSADKDSDRDAIVVFHEKSDLMDMLINEFGRYYTGDLSTDTDPEIPSQNGLWVWEGDIDWAKSDCDRDCRKALDAIASGLRGEVCDCQDCKNARIGFVEGDIPYFKNGTWRRLTDIEAINFARHNNPWVIDKRSVVADTSIAPSTNITLISGNMEQTSGNTEQKIQSKRPLSDQEKPKGLSTIDMFNQMIRSD